MLTFTCSPGVSWRFCFCCCSNGLDWQRHNRWHCDWLRGRRRSYRLHHCLLCALSSRRKASQQVATTFVSALSLVAHSPISLSLSSLFLSRLSRQAASQNGQASRGLIYEPEDKKQPLSVISEMDIPYAEGAFDDTPRSRKPIVDPHAQSAAEYIDSSAGKSVQIF